MGHGGGWINVSRCGEGETGRAVTSGAFSGFTHVFQIRALNAVAASPPSSELESPSGGSAPKPQSAFADASGLKARRQLQ